MSGKIPVREALNHQESQQLLAVDEAYIQRMMQITVDLNSLAEKAGALMKEYIDTYQEITAQAKMRPREVKP